MLYSCIKILAAAYNNIRLNLLDNVKNIEINMYIYFFISIFKYTAEFSSFCAGSSNLLHVPIVHKPLTYMRLYISDSHT